MRDDPVVVAGYHLQDVQLLQQDQGEDKLACQEIELADPGEETAENGNIEQAVKLESDQAYEVEHLYSNEEIEQLDDEQKAKGGLAQNDKVNEIDNKDIIGVKLNQEVEQVDQREEFEEHINQNKEIEQINCIEEIKEVEQSEGAEEQVDQREEIEKENCKEETEKLVNNKEELTKENIDTRFEDLFNETKEAEDNFDEWLEITKKVDQKDKSQKYISAHTRQGINEAKQKWEALEKQDQSEVDDNKNYKIGQQENSPYIVCDQTGTMADADTKTSRFGGTVEKCAKCNRTVYAMEKMEVAGRLMHKTCFRCCKCNSPLSVGRFSVGGGNLYCLTHYKQAFREKGTYDVFTPDNPCKGKWQPKAPE